MTEPMPNLSAWRQLLPCLLSRHWPVLLVLVLAAAMILPGLGKASLKDWGEAIYSQISKEIVQSGDWLTLHWGHHLWFEKPPLLMWGTAAFYRLFGVNEFCSRIVSALAGVFPTVGILSGVILITGSEFLFRARFGTTDILLTLSFSLPSMPIFACKKTASAGGTWYGYLPRSR